MQQLGHGSHVAGKVTFRPLGHAFAAPSNEGVLRQAGVGVFDFEESKLNSAIGKLVYQVDYLTLWTCLADVVQHVIGRLTHLQYSAPSRHFPCSPSPERHSREGLTPRRLPTGRMLVRQRRRQTGEGH